MPWDFKQLEKLKINKAIKNHFLKNELGIRDLKRAVNIEHTQTLNKYAILCLYDSYCSYQITKKKNTSRTWINLTFFLTCFCIFRRFKIILEFLVLDASWEYQLKLYSRWIRGTVSVAYMLISHEKTILTDPKAYT